MKKTFSLIIILIACLVLFSGFTLAYLTYKDEDNKVMFTTGKLQVDIEDTTINDSWNNWEPNEKKQITWTFKNAGTQSAHVRISFINSWTKKDLPESVQDAVYISGYEIREDDPEPNIEWILCSDDWHKESDGYYYYKGVVEPNGEVSIIFDATFTNLTPSYLGAEYNLSLVLESVQEANNPIPSWN